MVVRRSRAPKVKTSNEVASVDNRIVDRLPSGEGVWAYLRDGQRMLIGFNVINVRAVPIGKDILPHAVIL